MLGALSIPLTAVCTQDVNSELMEAAEDGEAERLKTLVAAGAEEPPPLAQGAAGLSSPESAL